MSRPRNTERGAVRGRGLFEHRSERLITRAAFARRLGRHALTAALIMTFSLFIGIVGYEHFEHLPWRDAFLNSAMLLGGMGPVDALKTPAGKLFAGFYALYAGIVFLGTATVLLAPVLHRILHTFHCDEHDA